MYLDCSCSLDIWHGMSIFEVPQNKYFRHAKRLRVSFVTFQFIRDGMLWTDILFQLILFFYFFRCGTFCGELLLFYWMFKTFFYANNKLNFSRISRCSCVLCVSDITFDIFCLNIQFSTSGIVFSCLLHGVSTIEKGSCIGDMISLDADSLRYFCSPDRWQEVVKHE